MRGAVTVAAAQTLPEDTPQRSVLVLIAFAVAVLSLLLQGGTIGPLLRRITPKADGALAQERSSAEWERITTLMASAAGAIPDAEPGTAEEREPQQSAGMTSQADFTVAKQHQLSVIVAQREALLDARDHGIFDADILANALANLDASQVAIEMGGTHAG